MLLSIKDLTISSHGVQLVSSLNLDIERGEVLGLVGASGSGKSLTGLTIIGLLPNGLEVKSGLIHFYNNDNPIQLLNQNEWGSIRGREIAMIFQEPMTALNPSRTCGSILLENISRYHGYSKKNGLEYAIQLLEETNIPNPGMVIKKYPHQLSGGQRQRVMIALAISGNPKLLIADEPTTALDVTVQKEILDLLKVLQNNHQMSMLFISHDLGVVKNICNRVAVMEKGQIVEIDHTQDLIERPKHPYTQSLIHARLSITKKDYLNNCEKNSEKDQLLKIDELDVYYQLNHSMEGNSKRFKALNQVSVQVFSGECVGLVGESGSGKTTLGRVVVRLIESVNGKIEWKGKDIDKLTKHEYKKLSKSIQYVFQDSYSSLNPYLNVFQAISEPLIFHQIVSKTEIENKVISLLVETGLTSEFLYRYPHELSGGQRQRVVIARALAVEPELLILDEALSALDVLIQAQMMKLLKEIQQRHLISYLFISHDLFLVKELCSRVYVMNKGVIEETGNTFEVFLNPEKEYTKKLVSSLLE